MTKKILILYTEYAAYLHACLRKLVGLYGYEVHVVRYPLDKNAPFAVGRHENIIFYDRADLTKEGILDIYKKINPDAVLVSGWIDNDYIQLVKRFKQEGKMVVAVVDNQWVGSLKQKLFTTFGKFFLNQRFTHFWIPGMAQFEYLRRIGVDADKLMVGYYSADSDLFLSRYIPVSELPKRFIYVGRLLDIKGTPTLLDAIEKVNSRGNIDWEFLIIGNGSYEEQVRKLAEKYSNIQYKSFMQPDQLATETASGGVFILPSDYDAWGVVVHEYAMLGYPLILSSMVGSRNYFITPGYNGYIFKSRDAESLARTMEKIMSLNSGLLTEMSGRSHTIGRTITTEGWAARLHESIESHYLS